MNLICCCSGLKKKEKKKNVSTEFLEVNHGANNIISTSEYDPNLEEENPIDIQKEIPAIVDIAGINEHITKQKWNIPSKFDLLCLERILSPLKEYVLNVELPPKTLSVSNIYGYRGIYSRRNLHYPVVSQNSQSILYYSGNAAILTYLSTKQQYYYFGHNRPIVCMCIHPDSRIAASGELGYAPSVHIWNIPYLERNDSNEEIKNPIFIVKLDKRFLQTVCMTFTRCGNWLLVVALNHSYSSEVYYYLFFYLSFYI